MKVSLLIAGAALVGYKVFKAVRWSQMGLVFAAGSGSGGETGAASETTFYTFPQIIESLKVTYPELAEIPSGLVMAIMQVESNFDPRAVGAAGEQGLMQVKPPSAIWVLNKYGYASGDLFDPVENIRAGMFLLAEYKRFLGSHGFDSWNDVIQAYNIGPGAFDLGKRNSTYLVKVLAAWYA